MDGLATVFTGMIVLAAPFLFWLRSKARARYEHDLAEISELAKERSRWLDELHSRLDALEKQDSGRESMTSEEGTSEEGTTDRFWFQVSFPCKSVVEKDIASKGGYWAAIETLYSEPVYGSNPIYRIDCRSIQEAKPTPEWWEDVSSHKLTGIEGLHQKRVRSHGSRRQEGSSA